MVVPVVVAPRARAEERVEKLGRVAGGQRVLRPHEEVPVPVLAALHDLRPVVVVAGVVVCLDIECRNSR